MKLRLLCLAPLLAAAARSETPVDPTIDGVELFKNGLAVVRASFPAPAAGDYLWNEAPRAVHGTFWVESDMPVETRGGLKTEREVADGESASGDLQRDLAGHEVVVHFKSGEQITGKVWTLPDPAPEPPDVPEPARDLFASPSRQPAQRTLKPQQPSTTGSFLVVETGDGQRQLLDRSLIARIETGAGFAPRTRWVEKPTLRFKVADAGDPQRRIRVSWLAHGLSWAPSYLVELGDNGRMEIEQAAVIRNELLDLNATEIGLISGFPHIRFDEVDSLLWGGTTLDSFFSQLGGPTNRPTFAIASNVAYQSSSPSPLPDLSEPGASGDDLHIEPIGPRDLARGESLSLPVARKSTDFERVVEWTVPDPRNARGRYQTGADDDDRDEPWDAISFRNPFAFPMTTAPAMIRDDGHFRGQTRSDWVNPGQTTCLRVTKALSIRADYTEIEEEDGREIVYIAGDDYQRTNVKGTLKLHNSRGEAVRMNVTAEFSGELLEAGRDPEKSLRTEGVSSVNPRRELKWTFDLGAGESTEISYRYSVLVDR